MECGSGPVPVASGGGGGGMAAGMAAGIDTGGKLAAAVVAGGRLDFEPGREVLFCVLLVDCLD